MVTKTEFSPEKFKAVVHYIIHKYGNMDNVGKTILWKLLYFSDFDFYELKGKPLTGERYSKLGMGPAPRHFDAIVDELKGEDKIKEILVTYGGKQLKKFVCLKEPSGLNLDADEIQHIEKTANRLVNMNATQISAYSHGDMPWKTARLHEDLDYEMVHYRSPVYSVSETASDSD